MLHSVAPSYLYGRFLIATLYDVTGAFLQRLEQEGQSMQKEQEYMGLVQSEQVVTSHGVGYLELPTSLLPSQEDQTAVLKVPCLLLEFAPHGTLKDVISSVHESRGSEKLGCSQQQTRLIVKQIATGLLRLHSKCVIHRDLKAGEIPHAIVHSVQ